MHRSLVRSRFVTCAVLLCAWLPMLVEGCGGKRRWQGRTDAKTTPILVDGRVSLRGSTPFQLLFLERADGTVYMVDSLGFCELYKSEEEQPGAEEFYAGSDYEDDARDDGTTTPRHEWPTAADIS